MSSPVAVADGASAIEPHGLSRLFGRGTVTGELVRRPAGVFALSIVVLLSLVAIMAPVITPADPLQSDFSAAYELPSAEHPLGTDRLGRDMAARVIYGARIALEVGFAATVVGCTIGLLLGLVAGYFAGKLDTILLVVMDAVLAFPALILGFVFLNLLGRSTINTVLIIGISFIPAFHRTLRAQVIAFKRAPFVEVERSLGVRTRRILFKHVFPNALPPLVILIAFTVPGAVVAEASLAFFGLGSRPPTPSWGVMLDEGLRVAREKPWVIAPPMIAIALITIGFTLLGEQLQEIMNPRGQSTRS